MNVRLSKSPLGDRVQSGKSLHASRSAAQNLDGGRDRPAVIIHRDVTGNHNLTHFIRLLPSSTMFSSKATIPILLILALVFIGFGDQFLPQPLSGTSYKTRVALDHWITGSFKLWQPKADPNARTERAIEQQESGKSP